MKKKTFLKKTILFLIIPFLYLSCEKDMYENLQNIKMNNKNVLIKNITLEEFNQKMNFVKNKPNLNKLMKSSKNTNHLNKTTIGNDIIIYTDDIKYVTIGDYSSYTMYLKMPNTSNNIFYNITIEERNGNVKILVNEYKDNADWHLNSIGEFNGEITSYRLDENVSYSIVFQHFQDLIEIGGTIEYTSGGTVGSWSVNGLSSTFPYNCDGVIETYVIQVPVMCSAQVHWPWTPITANNQCKAQEKAKYVPTTFYKCVPLIGNNPANGSNNSNPNNSNIGGGGATQNPSNPNPEENENVSIIPIVGNPEVPKRKPCVTLQELFDEDKQNINNDLQDIINKFNQGLKIEVSYSYQKKPKYNPDTDAYSDFDEYGKEFKTGTYNSVAINLGPRWYASIHLHPKNQKAKASMFSFKDLIALKDQYQNATNILKQEVSMTIVAPDPLNNNNHKIYALKVKDITALENAINNELNSLKWELLNIDNENEIIDAIHRDLAKLYTDNASNLEKTFLEKFSNFGLQLFERENNQWKELNLNDQNELEEKPCTN